MDVLLHRYAANSEVQALTWEEYSYTTHNININNNYNDNKNTTIEILLVIKSTTIDVSIHLLSLIL